MPRFSGLPVPRFNFANPSPVPRFNFANPSPATHDFPRQASQQTQETVD